MIVLNIPVPTKAGEVLFYGTEPSTKFNLNGVKFIVNGTVVGGIFDGVHFKSYHRLSEATRHNITRKNIEDSELAWEITRQVGLGVEVE